jgi:hypothetical protein
MRDDLNQDDNKGWERVELWMGEKFVSQQSAAPREMCNVEI